MKTAHTPGPWTDKAIDESQWGIYDARGWSVAQAHQIKVLSADLKQVERTANARLIAAAPDLLEACYSAMKDLMYVSQKFDVALGSFGQLDAAYRKATGEANEKVEVPAP